MGGGRGGGLGSSNFDVEYVQLIAQDWSVVGPSKEFMLSFYMESIHFGQSGHEPNRRIAP